MSVVEFTFRKAGEVFNFIKDRLCLLVPLGIWKIFRTDISFTPTASYVYYYVMLQFFYQTQNSLVDNAGRLLLSICLIIFLQYHLLFPIFLANTNYIFLNWGFMIYSCLLHFTISVGEVSYLLASSIQQIIQYRSCSFSH